MYVAINDGATRESHAALNGIVLPSNDPFWSKHYPPWEWGCRCQIVPVSRDDYADLQKEDAERAPDQRRIIEGARLAELRRGNIIRGPNEIVDVRPPDEKMMPGKEHVAPYAWHPGDLHMPVESLLSKYDNAESSAFRNWARQAKLEDTSTRTLGEPSVWNWLLEGEAGAIGRDLLARESVVKREFAAMFRVDDAKRLRQVPGRKTSVNIAPLLNSARQSGGEWVLVHTHPDNTSFSSNDLKRFLLNSTITEMRVIAPDKTFVLRKTPLTAIFAGKPDVVEAISMEHKRRFAKYKNTDSVISSLAKEIGYEYKTI